MAHGRAILRLYAHLLSSARHTREGLAPLRTRWCVGRRADDVDALVAELARMFGVSTSQHVLRRAGYRDGDLLRLGFLDSCLNVPYRVLLSALFIDLVRRLATVALS